MSTDTMKTEQTAATARRQRFNKALEAFGLPLLPDTVEADSDLALEAVIDLLCAVAEGRGSNFGERHGLK